MSRETERLLKDCIERTGRVDGTDWAAHCPCCHRDTEYPTALLAHRGLKVHYLTCRTD